MNSKIRKQEKNQRRLETMLRYRTKSFERIQDEIVNYILEYEVDGWITRFSEKYRDAMLGVAE